MNGQIEKLVIEAKLQLAEERGLTREQTTCGYYPEYDQKLFEKFTKLVVKECIDKIETYRIPVGNSCSGELAAQWTYEALGTLRDDIREHFGIE